MVRITGGRHQSRKPVKPRDNPILDLACRHTARPADHARHAKAALHGGSLAARERLLAAVRPSEVLRAVVGGECDDCVVVESLVLELLHYPTDDVVKLS